MGDERTSTALDERIGRRVRARRLELGISQEQLAAALGVTFQQVQKYEKGVNRIAASRLFDIARALDTPVSNFYDTERSPAYGKSRAGAPDLDEALALPGAIELLQVFGQIKRPAMRRKVLDLVRTLVGED